MSPVLRKSIGRARMWRTFYEGTLIVFQACVALLAAGLVMAAVDWAVPLSLPVRRGLWGVILAALTARAAYPWRRWENWRSEALALDLGRPLRPSDALLNAWELSRRPPDDDTSADLAGRDLREVERRLAALRVRDVMRPAKWRFWSALAVAAAAVFFVLAALLPASGRAALWKIYSPFAGGDLSGVTVSPGHARIPAGASVPVRVKAVGRHLPELWVSGGLLRWERRPMTRLREGEFGHTLENLLQPLSYKVRHRGRWTPVYELEVFTPPRFKSLTAEMRFPRYTGRAPETSENAAALRVPRGTRVLVRGTLDRPVAAVRLASSDGRALPCELRDGTRVSFEWEAAASADLSLSFDGEDLAAGDRRLMTWRMEVAEDAPPSVRILAPGQDLLVSVREKLPVTFEVFDDYGLTEAFLNYKVNDGPVQKISWKRFAEGGAKQGVFDQTWNLSSLGLRPGDVVRYHVSVRDNNALSGPGEGASAAFRLETASYEAEHAALEKSLDEFRRKLLDILAEESLLREEVTKEPADWDALAKKQALLRGRLAEQRAALEELVKKMRRDPMTDRVTAAEYEGLLDNLEEVERDPLSRAQQELAAKRAEPAGRAMEEAVAELERLSLLAEDVLQAGKMRDLLSRQEELTRSAEALRDELAADPGAPLSPADQKRMKEALDEIARLTQSIAEQLQKMPQELPEDFVNQEGVKSVRLDEVQSLMNDVQKALARGNAADALAAAEKLLKQLSDIQKTLKEAGDKTAGGPSWFGGALKEELDARRRELEDLVSRQEALKARTEELSRAALEGLSIEQDKTVEALRAGHPAWREGFSEFQRSFFEFEESELLLEGRPRVMAADASMKDIAAELGAPQLKDAPRLFDDLQARLHELKGIVSEARERRLSEVRQSTAPAEGAKAAAALERLEKDVSRWESEARDKADRLKPPASDRAFLSEAQSDGAAKGAMEQGDLREDTLKLRQKLLSLAQKTALLETKTSRRLAKAAEAMGGAEAALEKFALRDAVERQETALRYLREGREDMRSASQGAQGLGKSGGRPAAGSAQPLPSGGTGGMSGVRNEPVHIPRAEEYRPPKEFREELLKSMKEKYPKTYEEAVREYYESLSK